MNYHLKSIYFIIFFLSVMKNRRNIYNDGKYILSIDYELIATYKNCIDNYGTYYSKERVLFRLLEVML